MCRYILRDTSSSYVDWLFFAAYSAIANDSIQTIGTFLASNAEKKINPIIWDELVIYFFS